MELSGTSWCSPSSLCERFKAGMSAGGVRVVFVLPGAVGCPWVCPTPVLCQAPARDTAPAAPPWPFIQILSAQGSGVRVKYNLLLYPVLLQKETESWHSGEQLGSAGIITAGDFLSLVLVAQPESQGGIGTHLWCLCWKCSWNRVINNEVLWYFSGFSLWQKSAASFQVILA